MQKPCDEYNDRLQDDIIATEIRAQPSVFDMSTTTTQRYLQANTKIPFIICRFLT